MAQGGEDSWFDRSIHLHGESQRLAVEGNFLPGKKIVEGFQYQVKTISTINNQLSEKGLGYLTLDGKFYYTGPQTIVVGGEANMVLPVGFGFDGGLSFNKNCELGAFGGIDVLKGIDVGADIFVGSFFTNDLNGALESYSFNAYVFQLNYYMDLEGHPAGVTFGVGQGFPIGVSWGEGSTLAKPGP